MLSGRRPKKTQGGRRKTEAAPCAFCLTLSRPKMTRPLTKRRGSTMPEVPLTPSASPSAGRGKTQPGRWVVVSVHDIASPLTSEVRHLLAALDAIGARPRVLKIVPNADGSRDLRDHPALLRLLAAEVAAGSEFGPLGLSPREALLLPGPW